MWRPVLRRLADEVLGAIDLGSCSGCDACGLRCTAGIKVTRPEFYLLRAHAMADAEAAAAWHRGPHPVDLGDDVTVEACRLRDSDGGQCLAYVARPLICRLMGHVEWLPCPTGDVRRCAPTPAALELMHEYASEELHTLEEWESRCGS